MQLISPCPDVVWSHKYNAPIPLGYACLCLVIDVCKYAILWLEITDPQTLDLVQMVHPDITRGWLRGRRGLQESDRIDVGVLREPT